MKRILETKECENVNWSQEEVDLPSGVVVARCSVSELFTFQWCNRMVRFIVVEQNAPLLLPIGPMRTLQSPLNLGHNGDKVVFRRVGGEAVLRTFESGYTVISADSFANDEWRCPQYDSKHIEITDDNVKNPKIVPSAMQNDR